MSGLLFRDVDVDGGRTDVLVRGATVAAISAGMSTDTGCETIDGRGGALLPGLWDHHIHLLALAAARDSIPVGPPQVADGAGFETALRTAVSSRPAGRWIRAVGHHESVGGSIDRETLDRLAPHHPVRVQHRSGVMWVLNSRGLDAIGVRDDDTDTTTTPAGLERDGAGRATGRVFGADDWLRDRLPATVPPDLASVGRYLASRGVVGVTDATPYPSPDDLAPLAAAAADGRLPQHVVAMGGPALTEETFPAGLGRGPVKLLLADHSLPGLEDTAAWIEQAHAAGRPVAVHCVTRVSLVLALAAWEIAGSRPGDRVEHGAIVPPELRDALATAGLTVVTQPNFVAERGDQYLAEVDEDDRPHLYPCASLLHAGVPVGGSTDAPFGDPDPWAAVVAAVDRRTASGAGIGPAEAVSAQRALDLFLGRPDDPGGTSRRVAVGEPADLCLLDRPLADALSDPRSVGVRATVVDGAVVHDATS